MRTLIFLTVVILTGCDLNFFKEEDDPKIDMEAITVFQYTLIIKDRKKMSCPEGWDYGGKWHFPQEHFELILDKSERHHAYHVNGFICRRERGHDAGVGKETFPSFTIYAFYTPPTDYFDPCPRNWLDASTAGAGRKICSREIVGLHPELYEVKYGR